MEKLELFKKLNQFLETNPKLVKSNGELYDSVINTLNVLESELFVGPYEY